MFCQCFTHRFFETTLNADKTRRAARNHVARIIRVISSDITRAETNEIPWITPSCLRIKGIRHDSTSLRKFIKTYLNQGKTWLESQQTKNSIICLQIDHFWSDFLNRRYTHHRHTSVSSVSIFLMCVFKCVLVDFRMNHHSFGRLDIFKYMHSSPKMCLFI